MSESLLFNENRFFSIAALKKSFKKRGLAPKKRLGQNFLINKNVLKKILFAGELIPNDTVLEIGAGLGVLTYFLAKKVKKIIALEKDPQIVIWLTENLKNLKNVKIIEGDVRKIIMPVSQTLAPDYKIMGNIPYYLSSFLIRKIFELKNKPRLTVLTLQKEVAQRICAKPPNMNLLALSVQFFAKPKIVASVSKKAFWPEPAVDSAIIVLKTEPKRFDEILFLKFIKTAFAHPRKILLNNLQNLGISKTNLVDCFKNAKIKIGSRPQELSINDWFKLINFIKTAGKPLTK